jgi:hypothetical protein
MSPAVLLTWTGSTEPPLPLGGMNEASQSSPKIVVIVVIGVCRLDELEEGERCPVQIIGKDPFLMFGGRQVSAMNPSGGGIKRGAGNGLLNSHAGRVFSKACTGGSRGAWAGWAWTGQQLVVQQSRKSSSHASYLVKPSQLLLQLLGLLAHSPLLRIHPLQGIPDLRNWYIWIAQV